MRLFLSILLSPFSVSISSFYDFLVISESYIEKCLPHQPVDDVPVVGVQANVCPCLCQVCLVCQLCQVCSPCLPSSPYPVCLCQSCHFCPCLLCRSSRSPSRDAAAAAVPIHCRCVGIPSQETNADVVPVWEALKIANSSFSLFIFSQKVNF